MLEICCETPQDAVAAEQGGADRIELCVGLSVGGLTPSSALIAAVSQAVSLPIRALIRPREGHFFYDPGERQLIVAEARMALEAGASGVVVGGLRSEGVVDQELLDLVLARIEPSRVTFHRAFDESDDLLSAYDLLAAYRIDCVLTSGGELSALAGVEMLRRLAERPGGTKIMAGAGVRPESAAQILQAGVDALHLSARGPRTGEGVHRLFEGGVARVDSDQVASIRDVITRSGS